MVTVKVSKTAGVNGTANGLTAKSGVINGPSTPKISSITSTVKGQALLLWNCPSTGTSGTVTAYRFERKISGGSYALLVDRTDDAEPGMLDTGLTSGSTYYYRVSALTAEGFGPASPEVSVLVA